MDPFRPTTDRKILLIRSILGLVIVTSTELRFSVDSIVSNDDGPFSHGRRFVGVDVSMFFEGYQQGRVVARAIRVEKKSQFLQGFLHPVALSHETQSVGRAIDWKEHGDERL